MSSLALLGGILDIVARLMMRPARRGHPTERWQDKSRKVRRGRVAEELRQIRHFAQGASQHDTLSVHATPWTIETTGTLRAFAS